MICCLNCHKEKDMAKPCANCGGIINYDRSAPGPVEIAHALEDCQGNRAAAARRLGITRTELRMKMRIHGFTKPKRKKEEPDIEGLKQNALYLKYPESL